VILSSHILPEVQQTCQRVLIMNRGRLVAQDTPEGLTRALRGGSLLRMTVRGPVRQVAERLRAIEGVQSVRVLEVQEPAPVATGPGRREAAGAGEATAAGAGTDAERGDAGHGIARLEVATDGRDVREEVFFALAGKGWPLLELRAAEMTLEDVFVQLVTEEKAPAQPAGAGERSRRGGGDGR